MEIKYNEATLNRPDGTRMIEGPAVFSNLVEISRQLRAEKAWETNDLNGITVFKTDEMAMVLTILKKGTRIRRNLVEGPFTLLVLSGKLEVEAEAGNYTLAPACMLNFQPQVAHDLHAVEETIVLQMTNQ
jgi:quercetin dioxygenase-like cupin family protein